MQASPKGSGAVTAKAKGVGALGARPLRRRLLELGFVERATADLEALAKTRPASPQTRLASWELAMWHADKYTAEGARACLAHLEMALEADDVDPALQAPAAVLAAESHALLGDIEAARRVLEVARAASPEPNLSLATANLETNLQARGQWINDALSLSGVAPIPFSARETGSSYDGLPAVEGPREQAVGADGLPLVTIIMPLYNAESTIGLCLASVLGQSWPNLEVIVVDDCSTDGSCRVVRRYAERDSRVRLLFATANRGPYVARNLGLQEARGEFVTCSDADDWSHPQKIEVQARYLLENPEVVGTTSQWVRMTEDLTAFRRGNRGYYAQINMSSLMFRREPVATVMQAWDSVRFAGDSEFLARMQVLFGTRAVERLPHILAFARCSAGSLTAHSCFGFPGHVMGARREYYEAYRYSFTQGKGLRCDFPQVARRFAVPQAMIPGEAPLCLNLALVLATDLRVASNAAWAAGFIAAEKRRDPQARIGLVQLHSYEPDPRTTVDPKIRASMDRGDAQLIVYGESASCSLLVVKDLSSLAERQRYVPRVEAATVAVFVDELPQSADPDGAPSYELSACLHQLRHYFGEAGHWFPKNANIRRRLQQNHGDVLKEATLASHDWPAAATSRGVLVELAVDALAKEA